jgi:hypothetical protein
VVGLLQGEFGNASGQPVVRSKSTNQMREMATLHSCGFAREEMCVAR